MNKELRLECNRAQPRAGPRRVCLWVIHTEVLPILSSSPGCGNPSHFLVVLPTCYLFPEASLDSLSSTLSHFAGSCSTIRDVESNQNTFFGLQVDFYMHSMHIHRHKHMPVCTCTHTYPHTQKHTEEECSASCRGSGFSQMPLFC